MDRQRATLAVLWTEAGLLGVTMQSLLLWWLLAGLGDEQGAAAARLVAVCGGLCIMAVQILLVHLLALGVLRMKMESQHQASPRGS